ncbi:hypothetical protein MPH_07663 [Macrophomina phaseolina MS6]|uniref:Uncharacterized protein n=1 Tax=Macrophomina phaseolina (strain MS6) TaxID=1126212 RepID=K2RQV2_MACPH|nr:hypothetical protein MPH_07663 [Macrophomina phaseolina MS6]
MAPSPAVIMPGRMLPPPPPAPPHAAQQPKPDQPASGDENNTTTAAKGNGDRKGSDPTSSKPTSDVPIRIEATATDPALESGAPPGSPRGDTALAPLSTHIKHYTGLSTRVVRTLKHLTTALTSFDAIRRHTAPLYNIEASPAHCLPPQHPLPNPIILTN